MKPHPDSLLKSNPDAGYLNRYAICLTAKQYMVIMELLDHAEIEYKLGRVEMPPTVGDVTVNTAINKLKNARAI